MSEFTMHDWTEEDMERMLEGMKKYVRDISTLKPCPFCGADSCNLAVKEDEIGSFIYCARCDAVYTIANGTTEQIIKGWNRRLDVEVNE